MDKKTLVLLIAILSIAAFFRFYSLSSVPPSASLDEASVGWNAYSILLTGKDEYGEQFPILLRAYDDWRPALYVYFVVPFVKFLGLSALSVRLPAAALSLLTVLATYFLVEEIFRKRKLQEALRFLNEKYIALIAAFLLAISPWHIYISRLGHEANLGLSFLIFGVLFFLKDKIYLATFFLLMSFIPYQSEKIFIPVLILGLLIIFKTKIFRIKEKIFFAFILSLIVLVPFLKATFSQNALIRFKGTNVFEVTSNRFVERSKLLANAVSKNDFIGEILYNRRFLQAEIFAEGYLSHFNPLWLFTTSSSNSHKISGLGLLYIWELPLILIGLYVLIRYGFDTKMKALLFLWILISPIAASLTTDAPHVMRAYTFLPIWQIFSALGFLSILSYCKNKKYVFKLIFLASLPTVFISIIFLTKQYFNVFPKAESASFQYAMSKAVPYVKKIDGSYNKIVFSNNSNLFQSYMFFLFYTKYDPVLYQQQGGTKSGGYSEMHKFGKYEFKLTQISQLEEKTLYVENSSNLLNSNKLLSVNLINTFFNLDGSDVIKIFAKK